MKSTSSYETVASGDRYSSSIDMREFKGLQVYIPTIDSGAIALQGSHDGTNDWASMKDSSLQVLAYAASTGGFWLDADYLARFTGIRFLRVDLGAAQSAARTIRVRQFAD